MNRSRFQKTGKKIYFYANQKPIRKQANQKSVTQTNNIKKIIMKKRNTCVHINLRPTKMLPYAYN